MGQVYNYMIGSYLPKRETKYHALKRDELKKVYNNIVSLSNHSPFYKINLSKQNQDYTIGVKETALALKSRIEDMAISENSGFDSKTVSISNNQILSAKLINGDTDQIPKSITLLVKSLASSQVNRGKELFQPSRGLEPGTYEFSAKVIDQTYPLSYTQQERIPNSITMKNMSEYLNKSIPGLSITVEKGEHEEYNRMVVVSDATGTGKTGEKAFSFEEDGTYGEGIVSFLGLNRTEKAPTNASFELNGINKQTATNSFTLENTLHVSLHHSGEQPVTLRIVPDSERILTGVESVLKSYNGLIGLAKNRTEETPEHYRATRLISELKNLEKIYKEELEASGLISSEDGMLTLDKGIATQAAQDGGIEKLFTKENGFIAKVLSKADSIAINPMEYLDKIIVTYPDNEKASYANPYVTSMYSGLFFSSYC